MKKLNFILIFISFLMFMPFIVHAESMKATDYIKKIADDNGGDISNVETIGNTGLAYDGTTDNNLRYVGANPNNYIDISDYYTYNLYSSNKYSYMLFTDEQSCLARDNTGCQLQKKLGDKILWRIIGIIKIDGIEYLKIIRNNKLEDVYGDHLYWSYSLSTWNEASIKTNLNSTGYWNHIPDEVKNNLASVPFNIGTIPKETVYTYDFYEKESTSKWNGYIGLINPSDYGFASSGGGNTTRLECINKSLITYDSYEDCYLNNYITKLVNTVRFWMVNVTNSDNLKTYRIDGKNIQYSNYGQANGGQVQPVVFLKNDVKIYNGNGSMDTPYEIFNRYKIKTNHFKNNDVVVNIRDERGEKSGETIEINVNDLQGYIFKELIIKGNNEYISYEAVDDNKYSFIMPDSDVTITPVYEKIKSSINVEIANEIENLSIDIEDLTQVEYEEKVKFNVTPIKGYKVTNLKIVDEDNNEIEYKTTDNKNYTFTMPASNVTIISSYERVKNAVNVEDNKKTMEIIVEVNDAKAVVYEDKVVFEVIPEDGYVVEEIIIKDKNDNKINYKKLDNNKYEFIMPDTDVIITPKYRKIESLNVPNTLKNPNTGTGMYAVISLIILVLSISLYMVMKKRKTKF